MDTWDVVVVGGGLAGLTAGAVARAAGASTLVVEAHAAGGRARTTERDGFIFNLGAHALYCAGEGFEVLRWLGIQPKGAAPSLRNYRLLVGDELHLMPSGPSTLLRTSALSAASKVRLAGLLARLPRLDASRFAGTSVNEWLADQGLRDDAINVLRALVRISTYSSSLDQLSADAGIAQVQRAAAQGVVYLDGGWSQLVDALRRRVEMRRTAVRGIADGDSRGVLLDTDEGEVAARAVIVAVGGPDAAAPLLPEEPDWRDLGGPVTAACLDVGARRAPTPGYVLGVDDPVYGTTQGPPARGQAPEGGAVVSVIRYGARDAEADREQLAGWLGHVGVQREDVVVERFLARMVVTGAAPRPVTGGLLGRPRIDSTGTPNVFVAGDWVGPHGLLADASFASGKEAGLAAARVSATTAFVG